MPPDEDVPTALPLAGIRVADFSRVLAGPLATMLLGDLGADVVKVERPGTGDDTRGWGPPFVGDDAAYFLSLNRNKRSVALDLGTEDGRTAARRLALASDVVVENFRPGLMERFGLDHASLSAEHPGLVYCSLTAFGEDDATARPGYDIIVQALSGLMSFTGHPGGEPTKVGVALLDVICGLYASNAIQAALLGRSATGRGARVTVSLFDASVAALVNQAANYLLGGLVPQPLGNAHPNIVPYQLFETADRPFILAAGNDRLFERTCDVIGRPELATDERFATNAARVRHRDELIPILSEVLARTTRGRVARRVRGGLGPLRAGPNARRGLRVARGRGHDPVDRRPRARIAPAGRRSDPRRRPRPAGPEAAASARRAHGRGALGAREMSSTARDRPR